MRSIIPNRKSASLTPQEEEAHRQRMINNAAKVLKVILRLLKPLIKELPDPRDPRYITYSKEELLFCGIILFIHQAKSRRQANLILTEPFMQENLKAVFPGLNAIPHSDTVANYLKRIDAELIQCIYFALIKKLLRNKEFKRFAGRFRIIVDGSGKNSKSWNYSDKAQSRKTQNGEYWQTYVLNAVLILENGMPLPICTVFLENTGREFDKQDCEIKAWYRMAPKLRYIFGYQATILFDGLYASGPVILSCRKYRWDYVITLKDGSMPVFAEEAHNLMEFEVANRVTAETDEGKTQEIRWVNEVEHEISKNHTYLKLNVIRMTESWTVTHPVTKKPTEYKKVTYQWITSRPVNKSNAQKLCQLGRSRWLIENFFKTEKNDGYNFEHSYSLDWNANKAYHYCMNIGHFVNIMLMSSELFSDMILGLGGISGFVSKMRLVFSGMVLNADMIRAAVAEPFRWKLNPICIYQRASGP